MARAEKTLSKRMARRIDIWERAKAIVLQDDRKAVPGLIEELRNSRDVEVRTSAAYALGWLHDKRAVQPLLSALLNVKEHKRVRGEAAEVLGHMCISRSNAQVFDGLLKTISDQSSEVRFWSAFALGLIGNRRAIPALQRLVESDKATVRGWWAVSKEATDAIARINIRRSNNISPRKKSRRSSKTK
jgi:HEAT repeat protein